ncbi:MAG: NifB/NifX family molybdenum-iron cluster-binding protein [Eubacteriales bacterium]
MKIAVTYGDGEVFQHFGHCENFKVYTVEDGKVVASEVINPTEGGHGALAGFLQVHSIEVLICGGIGGGAKMALAEMGIAFFAGVQGAADASVEAFIKGELVYNPDAVCSHHHDDGHDCGEDKHSCCGN